MAREDAGKESGVREQTKESVEGYIQKHPEKSVLIAAGIGALAGAAAATAMMMKRNART